MLVFKDYIVHSSLERNVFFLYIDRPFYILLYGKKDPKGSCNYSCFDIYIYLSCNCYLCPSKYGTGFEN